MKLCRTEDFLLMNENSFKVAVLAGIKRLVETNYSLYFANGCGKVELESCVQSERAVIEDKVTESGRVKEVTKYMDIYTNPTANMQGPHTTK